MNAAITTTGTRTWKLVKAHYLAAALGAALAFSAVAGVNNVKSIDFSSSPKAATVPAASTLLTPSQPAEATTIYIVSSQAQADPIIAGENAAGMAGFMAGYGSQAGHYEVVVVDSLEAEAGLQAAMNEAVSAGSIAQFRDLRGR